jgi:hypothetical protein
MEMKRVGSFNITDAVVFGDEVTMKAVQKLLGDVFICSAIHNFGYGRFEYIGFSKHFQEVEEGEMAPAYMIVCQNNSEEEEATAHFDKL